MFQLLSVGWKPARVTMAMRNYYLLPRLGERARTFGSPTGVDLCNSLCLQARVAGGRKDRRGPASRSWPCAVPCWAGRAPCRGASGAGLGGGLAVDAPAGPPHPGEPVVSREGGEAGGAVLPRCRACRKDGLTLDALCFWKPAERSVCGLR